MTLYKDKYRIETTRLQHWDYRSEGYYFVTICTKNREHLFGEIENGEMILNNYGEIIHRTWSNLPNHYNNIILDEFIVMPNHIHAIIAIQSSTIETDTVQTGSVQTGFKPVSTNTNTNTNTNPKKHGISEFVRALKTFSAKEINKLRNTKGIPVFQPRFHDHIIRNEKQLHKIRNYIQTNPATWKQDVNNVYNNNVQTGSVQTGSVQTGSVQTGFKPVSTNTDTDTNTDTNTEQCRDAKFCVSKRRIMNKIMEIGGG